MCFVQIFILFCIQCDSVPLKCSPFHSALVSLQSLYTADSRKCKSLSPKWHSAQGSEGQYMESVHLNQRKCFFCLFFFWGKGRGWVLYSCSLAFPNFSLKWLNDDIIMHDASFSLLIYRLNIHHSKKGRTALETQLLRFRGINHRDGLGAGFPEMSSIGLEITLACDVCPPVELNTTSVLRPWVAVAEQLVPHCSVWVWWTLRQEIIIAS